MKYSLVLAGGGTLGAYQVGAIKFLKEQNVEFDIVVGTSIGAINGAFVAAHREDLLEDFWKSITIEDVIENGVNLDSSIIKEFSFAKLKMLKKSYGIIKGANISPFKKYLSNVIFPRDYKKSDIKFGLITSTYPIFRKVEVLVNDLKKDYVLPYIHASSACFPFFPKEKIDGREYVDGFYVDNLPIDYAIKLGAKNIIAIDLGMFSIDASNNPLTHLPNVKLINPKTSLGSFLNFDKKIIEKNMKIGYLDCKKAFGYLVGNKYYFNTKYSKKYVENVYFNMLSNHFDVLEKIRKILEKANKNSTVLDYVIFLAEEILDYLENEKLKIYNLNLIKNYIPQNSKSVTQNKFKISDIKEIFGVD